MKKLILIIISLIVLIVFVGILFIKLNTTAAANFTDDILRPLLGAKNVIFLEKIFFNVSDKVQQITYSDKNITVPQFNEDDHPNNSVNNQLELSPISLNKSFNHLSGEGIWKITNLKSFANAAVMAHTFVRPDPNRPFSIVTIAQLDMSQMGLGVVAGTKEPGGQIGNPGPGMVPQDIVRNNQLIAAFDGGFQYRDGEYGMIVSNKTYLPLKNDLGTVVGYGDGSFKIINYTGQDLGHNISFIRQNCPILIENGQMSVTDIKNKHLWGRTFTSDIFTWRTGMGITQNGNLLFAVGNNLTPSTLAQALQMAGATNAIQLDINPNWVRFNIFSPKGNGQYTSKPLTSDLKDGSQEYLTGNKKDFFYLYKK